MKKLKLSPGYTILEIMIVIAIISVIAAITAISITKVRENARKNIAKADMEMIAAAVRQLAWDTGKWPSGLLRTDSNAEEWDLTQPSAGLLSNDGSFKNWKGPYLAKVPTDPWGSKYFFDPDYNINGQNHIVIGSYGPNKTGRNRYNEDNLYVVIK